MRRLFTALLPRIVTERYRAGESVAELAQDYRLDPGRIEDTRSGARRVKPHNPVLVRHDVRVHGLSEAEDG